MLSIPNTNAYYPSGPSYVQHFCHLNEKYTGKWEGHRASDSHMNTTTPKNTWISADRSENRGLDAPKQPQTLRGELRSRRDDRFAWQFNQMHYAMWEYKMEFRCLVRQPGKSRFKVLNLLLQNRTENKTLFFHIIPLPLAFIFLFPFTK